MSKAVTIPTAISNEVLKPGDLQSHEIDRAVPASRRSPEARSWIRGFAGSLHRSALGTSDEAEWRPGSMLPKPGSRKRGHDSAWRN